MEEVWSDITLFSLRNQEGNSSNSRPATSSTHPLFLALPSDKESHCTAESTAAGPALFYTPPRPPPPAGTMLSLTFGSDSPCLDNIDEHVRPNLPMQSTVVSKTRTYNNPFDSVWQYFSCNKRGSEDDGSRNDRRHKRMMKNRESAARSRARRQAYTTELELKLRHLREENARLRREQERFCSGAVLSFQKKRALFRTLTAPF